MRFILDCSIAMTWCFEDEATYRTEKLFDSLTQGGKGVVPSHWYLEVSNVLLTSMRHGRISQDRASQFLSLLGSLPITSDSDTGSNAFSRTHAIAQESGLSSYEAAYLELAIRIGLPIASNDRKLNAVAEIRNVVVL